MFILDTNVVSELRKVRSGRADKFVTLWANGISATELFISAVTVLELELGILLAERRDLVQGRMLRTWLDQYVLPAFDGRILSVDAAVAQRSAKLHIPDPCSFRDGLIAATALVHGMAIVTRNVADFESSGVTILNPWKP